MACRVGRAEAPEECTWPAFIRFPAASRGDTIEPCLTSTLSRKSSAVPSPTSPARSSPRWRTTTTSAPRFPYPVVKQMGELGLFGLPFPEEYGGMGGDYLSLCLAIEELARVDSSVAITLEAGVSLGAMPVFRFGTEEQKREWLPRLCSGQALGAFGLTEPGGGSDAGATRTAARLEGRRVGDRRHQGVHHQLRHRHHRAGHRDRRHRGRWGGGRKEISSILVPVPRPGFTVARSYSKAGWHASDTHELSFAGCRVPADNLLGRARSGLRQLPVHPRRGPDRDRRARHRAGPGRASTSASGTPGEREAFGRNIGAYQAIQFKIADMEVRAHTVPAGLARRRRRG